MAPKVQVPMDFGVKYLESPSHCNLKFNLKEGAAIPANSMIISYNSPVIEFLTTDLMQTSIDVDDFCREAVQCFLESCYSGDLLKMSKTNFRDANKMANVFQVSWLIEKCSSYFKTLVDNLDKENYEEQLFLFQEAMFVWGVLKKRDLVDIVVEKFASEIVKCDQFFVFQFLNDLSSHSHKQLDVVIEIVGEQKHVLLEVLNIDIGKNTDCFSANSRYLLENVSFSKCIITHKAAYESLFEKIEALKSPSREDFGVILRLFKRSDAEKSALFANDGLLSSATVQLPCCRFLKPRHIINLPGPIEVMDFLVTFPLVTSSYIFFDAVYYWVFEKSKNGKDAVAVNDKKFIAKFIDILSKRDWKPLVPEYLEGKSISFLTGLIEKLETIPANDSHTNYSRLYSTETFSPEDFFSKDNDIKFFFKGSCGQKCRDPEKCGLILRTKALHGNVDDSFDIQLVIDPAAYPDDIYLHVKCVKLETMHLALEVDDMAHDFPISWSGRPSKDESKKYFLWGQHRFYKKGEGIHPKSGPTSDYDMIWTLGSDARIRIIVYHFE